MSPAGRGPREGVPLSLRAPAKINLCLRVLGPRADGFHDIETLFQGIALYDRIEVSLAAAPGVGLTVVGPDLGPTEQNLAVRAAKGILEAAEVDVGVRLTLYKAVPAGAGLGGGSSDAASVLRGLNELLGAPLSAGTLGDIGARLGSDVPFFLGPSPLALGRGRGEVLQTISPLNSAWVVLVLPPVHVATGEAYDALARARKGKSGAGPTRPPLEKGIATWNEVVALAHNDFERVVAPLHDDISRSLAGLGSSGARCALLSGTGAACFGIFEDGAAAGAAAAALSEELPWAVLVTRTLARGWEEPPGSSRRGA